MSVEKLVKLNELTISHKDEDLENEKWVIDKLAQDIKLYGLESELLVTKEGGTLKVKKGRNRFKALKLLLESGEINKNYKVEVVIYEKDEYLRMIRSTYRSLRSLRKYEKFDGAVKSCS